MLTGVPVNTKRGPALTSHASVADPRFRIACDGDYLFCVNFFSSATVSACRPLRRRALRTLRPPLVDMRARKPNLRMRLMRLGWYVRLVDTRVLLVPLICPVGAESILARPVRTRQNARVFAYWFRLRGGLP